MSAERNTVRTESVRFRLTVWYSLALAAGLACFACAIWLSMKHSLEGDLDRMLAGRARSVQTFLRQELADPKVDLREELDEYSHAFSPGTYLEVLDVSRGVVVFLSDPGFLRTAAEVSGPGSHTLQWHGSGLHVLSETFTAGGHRWRIVMAASLESINSLLDRLRLLLLTLLPLIVAVASLGGYWLSRRALKPVDQMTAVARSIGIENLSERLAVPQTGDELQRLAETWNAMLSRLEDAVKRLSRFTADASHELRTPLSVIRTTAEIASRRSRSAESYREALTRIVAESERTARLIEDLLFLARCDSDSFEMPMAPLDLVSVVQEVCFQITTVAESKGIRLRSSVPSAELYIGGNELALRRLILALLDNALQYSKPGGEVTVALRETGAAAELAIEDSGPGIPESDVPFIFDRFYRSPDARASGNGGSGLGLSIASGIAQRHNASIDVSTAPGAGSTFRVTFQLTAESHLHLPTVTSDLDSA